jgi:uncharacterized protein YycO
VHAEFAWKNNTWLGAQPRGGVAIRDYDYLGTDVEFDLFSVSVTRNQGMILRKFLEEQIGKPYDFKAIVNMGLNPLSDDIVNGHIPKRWFCSELVAYAFEFAGKPILNCRLRKTDRITPRDLGLSMILNNEK